LFVALTTASTWAVSSSAIFETAGSKSALISSLIGRGLIVSGGRIHGVETGWDSTYWVNVMDGGPSTRGRRRSAGFMNSKGTGIR
jgi:hypothetical protein